VSLSSSALMMEVAGGAGAAVTGEKGLVSGQDDCNRLVVVMIAGGAWVLLVGTAVTGTPALTYPCAIVVFCGTGAGSKAVIAMLVKMAVLAEVISSAGQG